MTSDEYHKMREENTKEWIVDELEKRGLERGLAIHNLRTLRESLLKDQMVASRTHLQWQPAEVWASSPFINVQVYNCFKQRSRTNIKNQPICHEVSIGEFCELLLKIIFILNIFLFFECLDDKSR